MFENAPVATIHLKHILHNFELAAKKHGPAKTMAVVKANAYGHGVKQVAQTLEKADSYAVARVAEALELRQSQAKKPIVVLEGYLGLRERDACREHDLTPMIHNDTQLEQLPQDMPFWLKFNTGMFRLGFSPTRAKALAVKLKEFELIGVASHFANADKKDHDLNRRQIEQFELILQYFPHAASCFANSGGILNLPLSEKLADWIRPGVMIYGGSPVLEAGAGKTDNSHTVLEPGMSVQAPVIAINDLQPGDRVGYGSTWEAKQNCRVAVIAFGYADGYPREAPTGTPVLVNNERRELVGRVSMDMCTVLLQEDDEVSIGDRVTFWGRGLSVDEVAHCTGTISYTLMTGLGSRVRRVYE